MKLLKAIRKLFERPAKRKGDIPPSTIDQIIAQSSVHIPKGKTPIDQNRIEIDCTCILVQALEVGYQPAQVLLLLAKVYGTVMCTYPHADDAEVKESFKKLCELELEYHTKLKHKMQIQGDDTPRRLH